MQKELTENKIRSTKAKQNKMNSHVQRTKHNGLYIFQSIISYLRYSESVQIVFSVSIETVLPYCFVSLCIRKVAVQKK